MDAAYTREQKIFIQGPAGPLETLVFGLDKLISLENKTQVQPEESEMGKEPQLVGIVCHPHPLHHGTMHHKVVTTVVKGWQEMGLATLRFNFRGVGESVGKYGATFGEVEDLKTIMTEIQKHYPNIQFWLGGFSFGAYISLKVASDQAFQTKALLSVAPPVHLFDFTKMEVPTCPWVIVQGYLDTVAPYQKVLKLYEELKQNKENLEFVPLFNADHFFHGHLIDLRTVIQDSFKPYF